VSEEDAVSVVEEDVAKLLTSWRCDKVGRMLEAGSWVFTKVNRLVECCRGARLSRKNCIRGHWPLTDPPNKSEAKIMLYRVIAARIYSSYIYFKCVDQAINGNYHLFFQERFAVDEEFEVIFEMKLKLL
jgi:hypothetical protein